MKGISKQGFGTALCLAMVTAATTLLAGPKTEAQLIQELSSTKETAVIDALKDLERLYPTSATARPEIKKLLTDPRTKVKRKAARVLGAIHADVDEADLKHICELLQSSEKDSVLDGLKSLRGLKAQSTIPQITPLLSNPDLNIMRDACRTLAVLGDKKLVPQIEPLLKHPDPHVQKDAQDAIFQLNSKS